eukprot:4691121-Prymnesium_polylepis.1
MRGGTWRRDPQAAWKRNERCRRASFPNRLRWPATTPETACSRRSRRPARSGGRVVVAHGGVVQIDDKLRERLNALVTRATAGAERPQLHRTLQSKQKGAYM